MNGCILIILLCINILLGIILVIRHKIILPILLYLNSVDTLYLNNGDIVVLFVFDTDRYEIDLAIEFLFEKFCRIKNVIPMALTTKNVFWIKSFGTKGHISYCNTKLIHMHLKAYSKYLDYLHRMGYCTDIETEEVAPKKYTPLDLRISSDQGVNTATYDTSNYYSGYPSQSNVGAPNGGAGGTYGGGGGGGYGEMGYDGWGGMMGTGGAGGTYDGVKLANKVGIEVKTVSKSEWEIDKLYKNSDMLYYLHDTKELYYQRLRLN